MSDEEWRKIVESVVKESEPQPEQATGTASESEIKEVAEALGII